MEHHMKEQGVNIAVPVPATDPGLYRNKSTDDILALLSRHRYSSFTIGELARTTGHTKPTVGRAIDDLSENDLVTAESEGNRRLVQINSDRLIAPDDPFLRIPQGEFQPPVRSAVEAIDEALDDIVTIILYGSVARGTADRRSDIDLWVLVERDRTKQQRRVNEVRLDLEDERFNGERYRFDIDVEELGLIPRYTENIREIVGSGIPLYRTPEYEKIETFLLREAEDR